MSIKEMSFEDDEKLKKCGSLNQSEVEHKRKKTNEFIGSV
jgi:hypothetical protein